MQVADYNKNERQINFNSVKGTITEINRGDVYSYIILSAGHERRRMICFSIATERLDTIEKDIVVGSLVMVKFYVASKRKDNKWFTNANIISISHLSYEQ